MCSAGKPAARRQGRHAQGRSEERVVYDASRECRGDASVSDLMTGDGSFDTHRLVLRALTKQRPAQWGTASRLAPEGTHGGMASLYRAGLRESRRPRGSHATRAFSRCGHA